MLHSLRSPLILLLACLVCAPLVLSRPAPVRAQVLNLENLVVDSQEGHITVRFGLHLEEAESVRLALMDGAVAMLTADAQLDRDRSFWFNDEVSDAEYSCVLRYEPLTRQFVAEPNGRPVLRDADFEALLQTAWNEIGLKLGRWKALARGRSYALDLYIRLARMDVPVWLRSVLFFWTWDFVPTAHYRLEFVA